MGSFPINTTWDDPFGPCSLTCSFGAMAIVSPYDEKWETVLFFSPQLQSWIEHLINMQTSIHIQEQNELWPFSTLPFFGTQGNKHSR